MNAQGADGTALIYTGPMYAHLTRFSSTLGLTGARKLGHQVGEDPFFDTVKINVGDADKVLQQALKQDMNLRKLDSSTVTIALDETTKIADVDTLLSVLNGGSKSDFDATSLAEKV